MNEIIIPVPTIKLTEIIKRKAADAIDMHLRRSDLSDVSHHLPGYKGKLIREIEADYQKISGKEHRLLFISIILIYLAELYEQIEPTAFSSQDKYCLITIQDVQYHFYSEIEVLGFNIDTNSFTSAEINHITGKVETIIESLDRIQAGQNIIFERIEELKEDYKDILTSFGLGKKPFLQRFAGVSAAYFGEKGADELFKLLKPMTNELIQETIKQLS